MKNAVIKSAALVLTLFALLTLFMSSSVIFNLFGVREKEGNYVLFIVITNFVAGFLYLLSVYGLLKSRTWTVYLLATITVLLILGFLGLLYHINSGGIYEIQTVKAMLFRISVTALFTGISWWYILKGNPKTKIVLKNKIETLLLILFLSLYSISVHSG